MRSEDSLCAFSNSQEFLAIANMLNINIKIFTYGIGGDETRCEWKEICPDPVMAATAHFPEGWVPDMYLYNLDQTHYDLLVGEDHRLALLGLVATKENIEEAVEKEPTVPDSSAWEFVGSHKSRDTLAEKILEEADFEDYDDVDLEELDDEVIMARSKKSGFKRVDPSSVSESASKEKQFFKCTWKSCKMQLESQGLLTAHLNEHKLVHECAECDEKFADKANLVTHKKTEHGEKEWNCDSCSFQAKNL